MNGDLIKDIAAVSECFENIRFDNSDYKVPYIFVGMNGVYIVVDTSLPEKEMKSLINTVKQKLNIIDTQLFSFIVSELDEDGTICKGSFYDYTEDTFIEYENIIEAFENCYANHLIPDVDLRNLTFHSPTDYLQRIEYESDLSDEDFETAYITPILSKQKIEKAITYLTEIYYKPTQDGNYRIYPDGSMEIKRTVTQNVGIVRTFVPMREVYYPCTDIDGETFFKLALFGGWFGLHKFKTGNIGSGIFYALTLGFCGVFYILDLVSILIGGYSYNSICDVKENDNSNYVKRKYYSRPLAKGNKKKAILGIILALIIIIVVLRFVYVPLLSYVSIKMSNSLQTSDLISNWAEKIIGVNFTK